MKLIREYTAPSHRLPGRGFGHRTTTNPPPTGSTTSPHHTPDHDGARRRSRALLLALALAPWCAQAQHLMSTGPVHETFGSLSTTGTENPWMDNATLPGWYASQSAAPNTVTNYRGATGTATAGALYSFGLEGTGPLTDRALGSLCSGTVGSLAYGLRLQNDTGGAVSNLVIEYVGEQWRNANNTAAQTLSFSYRVSDLPLTNADASGALAWIAVPTLDFTGPSAGAFTAALDGNHPTNRVALSNVLSGVVVASGEEIFLRWRDADDAGTDHALGIDDVRVSWASGGTTAPLSPALTYATGPEGMVLSWTDATFSLAWGTDPSSVTNRLPGVTSPHTNAADGVQRFFRLIWP